MGNKINKLTYWAPRILSIMFICFLALFSLDVFSPELSFWQIAVGLFMHNIPSLILLVVLLISWKYEIVGGVAFILAGLLFILIFQALQISWPAFLIGILFIIGWFKKIKNKIN